MGMTTGGKVMTNKQPSKMSILMMGFCLIGCLGFGMILTGLPAAYGEETWATCTPVETMLHHNRLHVRCAESIGGIRFFALGTSDAFAPLFLSVIETAHVAGRTLKVLYDPLDLSGSSINCQNADCRLILSVGFE
jgi:hypothetical protein